LSSAQFGEVESAFGSLRMGRRESPGPGRSGAPDEVRRTSLGTRPPSLSTPAVGTAPSGWSRPHSVTRSPRMWIHVDPMAFNVERSSGGQGGRGLEAGSGDKAPWRPGVLPGMAGVRDNLQQLVEQRIPPPSWTTGGFNGADNLREAPLSGRIGLFHLGFRDDEAAGEGCPTDGADSDPPSRPPGLLPSSENRGPELARPLRPCENIPRLASREGDHAGD